MLEVETTTNLISIGIFVEKYISVGYLKSHVKN